MTNAKQELLLAIGSKKIAYGMVKYEEYYGADPIIISFRDDKEFHELIDHLDFEYDSGFGRQYIFGCIVFTDKTWLSRSEYDGSEWWKYNFTPNMNYIKDMLQ